MPRRKLPSNTNPNMAWEVINGRHKCNPIDELVKLARMKIKVPDKVDPKILAAELRKYDLITDDDGQRWLVPPLGTRIEIWKDLATYVAPKLRSSETKEEKDYNISVTIKTFDEGSERPRVIDVTPTALNEPKSE